MLSHDKMFQQILKKFGKKPCFFGDRKADFTIKKQIFQKIPWFIAIKVQFRL